MCSANPPKPPPQIVPPPPPPQIPVDNAAEAQLGPRRVQGYRHRGVPDYRIDLTAPLSPVGSGLQLPR